jgi:hypothetical protein
MGSSTPVEFELKESTTWDDLRVLAVSTYVELEPHKEKIALTYIDNESKQETTMVHNIPLTLSV